MFNALDKLGSTVLDELGVLVFDEYVFDDKDFDLFLYCEEDLEQLIVSQF